MANLMIRLAVLNTKIVVNAYTAVTLPLYTVFQRPWQKLRANKSFGVETFIDKQGRTVYHRPSSLKYQISQAKFNTFSEIFNDLDRNRLVVGVRDIVAEHLQLDENGKPIIVLDRELVKVKLADQYRWFTVGEILDKADAIARGLNQLGLKRGDKVMIYADSSIDWLLVAIALIRSCAVTVTLFSTLGDSGVAYGLNQSEARYLIIGEPLLKKFHKLHDQIQCVETIIYLPNHPNSSRNQDQENKLAKEKLAKKYPLYSIHQVMAQGEKIKPYDFPKALPEELLLIMYTSGTTGNPKGVLISNQNLQECIRNLQRSDFESKYSLYNTKTTAFLPMAHLYGYMTNLGAFITDGMFGFSSPLTLSSASPFHVAKQLGDIELVKPDALFVVPLMLEKIIKEINKKLNERSLLAVEIFNYLMEYKIRWTQRGFDTPIMNRLICKKLNALFGGNLKVMAAGGAPLNEKTQALAKAIFNLDNLLILYGSTEMQFGTCMPYHDLSLGRVGVPSGTVKYYLDDWTDGGYTVNDKPNPRGELVFGGPSISQGYYKMPEETAKEFYTDEDGCRWFRSGDIGEVFPDGTLKIVDRKKDLHKLANGEFISLGKIEAGLRSSDLVENVCVCTDRYRSDIIALILPNRQTLEKLARQLGKEQLTFEQLCDDPLIKQKVLETLQQVCKEFQFKKREIPVMIEIVKETWTQDNNMLTAAFKLRRQNVYKFYQKRIKEIFDSLPSEF